MACRLCFSLLWALLSFISLLSPSRAAPTDIPSAASFYVKRLPDLHQDDTHPLHIFSGHISSDPDAASAPPNDVTAHLFFVMVKARRTADKERIMFWFNGGPGCSSFDGLMMEVGPWRVDGNGGLKTIEGGWEEYTTMVYVDQPAGTGFSYTSTDHYVHELDDASTQLVEFLRNFYRVFPEYQNVDTYLGGESFAGQYIPYFADAILKSNLNIPLRGAAIGNGWIDGRHQYPSFLTYAVKHGLVEENSEDYKRGKAVTDRCMQEMAKYSTPEPVKVDVCESVMEQVVSGRKRSVDGKEMCVNIYDVRLEDEAPACGMNWPSDLPAMYDYLKRRDVVSALHATDASQTWTECRGIIHTEFTTRTSPSSITVIPKVLERIPMMLFAGDQDFICNYVGIESLIQAMTWNGETGLGTVQTQSWSVDSSPAGTWVTSRNLTYVKIFNASHMAGFDVPHVTHDMILRFMGVDFSKILEGSAKIPSSVGDDSKPLPTLLDDVPVPTPVPAKTPEQDKAMWEAYYNAGSAALVLVIIAVIIGGLLWWRSRRNRMKGLPLSTAEENIPLADNMAESNGHGAADEEQPFRSRKGKERAHDEPHSAAIFSVGDSDDEDMARSPRT
ncbi:alpha/beta-hydrolase [Laetiporus sulphureus 93-53]|uniref:Pheromone-processing carboxypeptidase KEX1 n=1 Tax=Laetiporus sulphureus 93-53 TaxID=1314785 RepID=A0A165DSR9_9APHY|nr:alpha/beta-hydrolase [Laetiporus sulphureus 93-53]KZT05556.1 alpha/beta-hydrolase [Laetiporus sulphureus 93-53]